MATDLTQKLSPGYCPCTKEYTGFEVRDDKQDVSSFLCANKRVVKGGVECLAQKEQVPSFSQGKLVIKTTYKPCPVYGEWVRGSQNSPSCTERPKTLIELEEERKEHERRNPFKKDGDPPHPNKSYLIPTETQKP
jgi:hypothetical protein